MVDARPKRRTSWSRPLADLVLPSLTPSLAQHGFEEAGLLILWPEIVGSRLAERCEPLRLQWPRRGPDGGEAATLVVRVEGAFAIELQHQAPVVVERINAHLGWRCVGRLALRQGPLRPKPAPRASIPPPSAEALAAARAVTAAIGDDGLREALTRLGARLHR